MHMCKGIRRVWTRGALSPTARPAPPIQLARSHGDLPTPPVIPPIHKPLGPGQRRPLMAEIMGCLCPTGCEIDRLHSAPRMGNQWLTGGSGAKVSDHRVYTCCLFRENNALNSPKCSTSKQTARRKSHPARNDTEGSGPYGGIHGGRVRPTQGEGRSKGGHRP